LLDCLAIGLAIKQLKTGCIVLVADSAQCLVSMIAESMECCCRKMTSSHQTLVLLPCFMQAQLLAYRKFYCWRICCAACWQHYTHP